MVRKVDLAACRSFADVLARAERYEAHRSRVREARRRAGLVSAAVRRAKLGENFTPHMRALARVGGRIRYATMSREELREIRSIGGKASWARLTPEQAAERRRNGAEAVNSAMTPEQRSARGRKGALERWRRREN